VALEQTRPFVHSTSQANKVCERDAQKIQPPVQLGEYILYGGV